MLNSRTYIKPISISLILNPFSNIADAYGEHACSNFGLVYDLTDNTIAQNHSFVTRKNPDSIPVLFHTDLYKQHR